MSLKITGKTRVYMTVGYPISQVKSPGDITEFFQRRNVDAVHIPLEVQPKGINEFIAGVTSYSNVDGLIMTIPYKFEGANLCSSLSPRAAILNSANLLRRTKNGEWYGDMTDGIGFCNAMEVTGTEIAGSRALLIGAGGAGSAIALELLERGVTQLHIFDIRQSRAVGIAELLNANFPHSVHVTTSPNPFGFNIIAHASPTGMNAEDPLPLEDSHLISSMHVGDVVTAPPITSLIRVARERGCNTHTGIEMWEAQQNVVVDFLLHEPMPNES